jgi:hypothetical protein
VDSGAHGAWSAAWRRLQDMGADVAANAPNVVIAAVALLLFFALGRAVRALVARVGRTRRKHRNYTLVLGRLAQGLVTVFGVLVACVIVLPNFTPASLVSFLGIGSVAIGFAFRDVLQNYLAGILLLLTEPFRIGDQIVFGEFEGTVENIETRATFIRTYDGRRVVVPNAELFTNAVMVNTAFEKRRLEYDVGVGYGDDVDRAKALILEAMRRVDGVHDGAGRERGRAPRTLVDRATGQGERPRRARSGAGGHQTHAPGSRNRSAVPDAPGALPRSNGGGGRRPRLATRRLAGRPRRRRATIAAAR